MVASTLAQVEALRWLDVSKKSLERRLAEQGLGIIDGLRNNRLSIRDAESDLFNMKVFMFAKQRRLSKDILEILQYGIQLEDVEELAPGGIEESYLAIEELARNVLKRHRSPLRGTFVKS